MATTCLCYTSGLIDTTIGNFGTAQSAAYAAASCIFLLSLFILAIAPGSGGHINPLIAFSTTITGLTGFFRGVLYMMGQTIGAALAGGTSRGSFGTERAIQWQGGGCFREPGIVNCDDVLFGLLVLSCGVALDPRQQNLMGPVFGPLAVGSSLGLVVFASVGLVSGYSGAGANPARCFALLSPGTISITNASGGLDRFADHGYWPSATILRHLTTVAPHREIRVIVSLNTEHEHGTRLIDEGFLASLYI